MSKSRRLHSFSSRCVHFLLCFFPISFYFTLCSPEKRFCKGKVSSHWTFFHNNSVRLKVHRHGGRTEFSHISGPTRGTGNDSDPESGSQHGQDLMQCWLLASYRWRGCGGRGGTDGRQWAFQSTNDPQAHAASIRLLPSPQQCISDVIVQVSNKQPPHKERTKPGITHSSDRHPTVGYVHGYIKNTHGERWWLSATQSSEPRPSEAGGSPRVTPTTPEP